MKGIISSKSFTATLPVWIGVCLSVNFGLLQAASLVRLPNTKVKHDYVPSNHIPVFSGSALVRLQGNLGASPSIDALDLQGNLVASAPVVVPNARLVGVNAFSRDRDGALAVGGWSRDYDDRSASFVGVIAHDGSTLLIRNNRYGVEHLAFAADGTIWTVGNVLNGNSGTPDADPKGGTVRHFDRSAKLIESFFPFASLNDRIRVMMSFLRASQDRVGWISTGDPRPGKGRLGAYIEFVGASTPCEYPLPPIAPVPGAVLYGLALTDNGAVLAMVLVEENKEQMFSLNRPARSWEPVSVPDLPAGSAFLLGASGNSITIFTPETKDVLLYQVTK